MTCRTAPEISSAGESAEGGVAAGAYDTRQAGQAAPLATAVWPTRFHCIFLHDDKCTDSPALNDARVVTHFGWAHFHAGAATGYGAATAA